ncbi:MgtC/SapB family protein [Pseudogemmobacter sp. W21_MBD1_M6]|uniref:MgtC/SapB family protein n=1 Tax=Pseudogemmobacter sp. W21_MBD1_M6 TaxID=3240271 RepID=UPI003F9DF059
MDHFDIFIRLGLALAIGLLLGLERGWHGRKAAEGDRTAGIRTFALTGLLGGICGWLAVLTTPVFPALAFLALGALLAVSYWVSVKEDNDLGFTTEIALLLTFVLGVVSLLGEMAPAVAVAVVAALLLSMKPKLHSWIRHIRRLELEAVFKLALISGVVLPLLPDQGYGPGAVLNPYELWWAVVIVAGLSFVGYFAIRLAGAGVGILATGIFGGLASSTSTTLALARLARANDSMTDIAAAGIIVAGSVTFLRILALVGVFEPSLIVPLALPMGAMALTGLAGAALVYRATDRKQGPKGRIGSISNPFELTTALAFGAILAVVLLVVHYLKDWLGMRGVYAAATLSGISDVDALTISVSRLVGEDLLARHAAIAIFIAVSVNTAVKGGISMVAGNTHLGLRVIAVYAAVIGVGSIGLWLGV